MPRGLVSVLYFILFKGKILFFLNRLRCDLTVGMLFKMFFLMQNLRYYGAWPVLNSKYQFPKSERLSDDAPPFYVPLRKNTLSQ